MVVKELHSLWPPTVTEAGSTGVTADLGDVVVSVQNKSSGKLIVRLRKNHNHEAEYAVTLSIPREGFTADAFVDSKEERNNAS
jgi:hypothetical protein